MAVLWVILGLLGLLIALLLIAVVRTLLLSSKKSAYVPSPNPDRAMALAKKLSRMVQYDTVSVPDTDQREKFLGFQKIVEERFPLVHERLEKTEIDGNLLFF
jgi:carboxypeptidase PM20D1